MSEVKFTPGPWYPVEFAGYWYLQKQPFYDADNVLDAEVCPEAKANANLAAASPEMYEALKDILSLQEEDPGTPGRWWTKVVPTNEQLNKIKAALSKAEGKQP